MDRAAARRFKTTTTRAPRVVFRRTTFRTFCPGPPSTSCQRARASAGLEVVLLRGFSATGKLTSSCRHAREHRLTYQSQATLLIFVAAHRETHPETIFVRT